MGKLVVLKLDGDLQQHGFRATLEIGAEGQRPTIEVTGQLPPAPDLATRLDQWRENYRILGTLDPQSPSHHRIKPGRIIYDGSVNNRLEECRRSARELSDRLTTWLNSKQFRDVSNTLREELNREDTIRLLIRTNDDHLQKLPWQEWNFFERYPKAEFALSATKSKRTETLKPNLKAKVRILAILGNCTGIDVEKDRQVLESLPNAETFFLVEPQRDRLNNELWQEWDILFFAGHSETEGNSGRIYINQTDSLTIEELKYALEAAIAQGLQLAIFNSCDGLGLARELEQLHIPQLIVMREPVPDRVAQEFLKHFLTAFANGASLYLAEREAKEKLQGLEDKFPHASWLPAIYQNSAFVPPSWEKLRGREETPGAKPVRRYLSAVFLASIAITLSVMGVRYLGMLQSLELPVYDQSLRLRPEEGPDPRLLVVTVTEADIQAQKQEQRQGSLSNRSLARLLEKLEQYQPRAIGLDIYRDLPIEPKYRDLATRLRRNNHLIAVCKVSDPEDNDPGIPPPSEIPANRLGFSDVVLDPDGIIRRHLLALTPPPASPCAASYSLSVQLAFLYLDPIGISPHYTKEGLQLGSVVFQHLESHTGGYQGVDAWGHQVLLNYRSHHEPQKIAPQVTLTQVLTGQLDPSLVKDRIVLIGITAESGHDYWSTPESAGIVPGVIIQAQMVSQILSAVLDRRPLLWVWPLWGETLWVFCWSLGAGTLGWRFRSLLHIGLAGFAATGVLCGLCLHLFIQGCWVPLVPAAIAIVATGGSVAACRTFYVRPQ